MIIRIVDPDIPAPNATADEVGVVVGDAQIVDGGNCFGRADRRKLTRPPSIEIS
ncbi:MAG: hypothetical protein R3C53_08390 [Pirellulaceae bacterium]